MMLTAGFARLSRGSPIGGVRTFYAALNDPLVDGPPSAETWAKVKAEFTTLADAADADLNDALAGLPVADYRDLAAERKQGSGFSGDVSGGALSTGAPIAVLVLAAAALIVSGVGGGDACTADSQSRACIEKQQRASGVKTKTSLEKYSEQLRGL